MSFGNGNGNGEVVSSTPLRTGIGTVGGVLKDIPATDLGATVGQEVLSRSGVEGEQVDQVIVGNILSAGQGMNPGRQVGIKSGLPVEVPATTVDRRCGSAQQAVNFGAALVAAGVHDAVIGSGVEHMGHVPMGIGFKWADDVGSPWTPELMERYALVPQGLSAEMIADKWELPRHELDELALRAHQVAARATEEGRFEREIVPFAVNGDTFVADQGIRPDTTLEALAGLKPAFKPDGRVTAGNSSQISDGAAAVLLMTADRARDAFLPAPLPAG